MCKGECSTLLRSIHLALAAPNLVWTRFFGAPEAGAADAITSIRKVGSDLYIAGSTYTTRPQRFAARLASDRSVLWTSAGSLDFIQSTEFGIDFTTPSLDVDPASGAVYLGGRALSTSSEPLIDGVSPGVNSSTQSPNGTITKLDANGNRLWTRLIEPIRGGRTGASVTDLRVLDGQTIAVVGFADGELAGADNLRVGDTDAFLALYDNAGNRTNLVFLGPDIKADDCRAFANSPSVIYLGGSTVGGQAGGKTRDLATGYIYWYSSAVDSVGVTYLADLDSQLAASVILDLAVDGKGNVYAVGSTLGGRNRGFLAKLGPNASKLEWVSFVTSNSPTNAEALLTGVTVAEDGSAYVVGQIQGSDGFSSFTGSANSLNAYAGHFSSSGSRLSSLVFGSSNTDLATDCQLDSDGNLLVVGSTSGSFGGQANQGSSDGFLTKVDFAEPVVYVPGGKTIGSLNLGTTTRGDALRTGAGSVLQIVDYQGNFWRSTSSWRSVAAASEGTGFLLFLTNSQTSQYAYWFLDDRGIFQNGKSLTQSELFSYESRFNTDLNDDGSIGNGFSSFTDGFKPGGNTINDCTLGENVLGAAIRLTSGAIVQITDYSGQYFRASLGWKATAAATYNAGFLLFLANSQSKEYAYWLLDDKGRFRSGDFLSQAGLLANESIYNVDLDGDGKVGVTYTAGPRTINNCNLGETVLGAALRVGNGAVVQIVDYRNDYFSAIAGWKAFAATTYNSGYLLFLANSQSKEYAYWLLDDKGRFRSGDSLSKAGLLANESIYNVDLDEDGFVGVRYTAGSKTINNCNLGETALGAALRVGSGAIVQIIDDRGAYFSNTAGWKAFAATTYNSGYLVFLANSQSKKYAYWLLDDKGRFSSGDFLSQAGLLANEKIYNVDLDGDGKVGVTYTPGAKTVGGVNLGSSGFSYAVRNAQNDVVLVRFNEDVYASDANPGQNWKATAAISYGNGYLLLVENSVENRSAAWQLDQTGKVLNGYLATTTIQTRIFEVLFRKDLDGDGIRGPFRENGGTANRDLLTGGELTVTFGFAGDDEIAAGASRIGFDIELGGKGNDRYTIAAGRGALIHETGNDPGDALICPGLRLNGSSSSTFYTLDGGRHLLGFDTATSTTMYLYDWKDGTNRLESFQFADGTFTFAQVQSRMTQGSLPDYSWGQIASLFNSSVASSVGFSDSQTVDLLMKAYAAVDATGTL